MSTEEIEDLIEEQFLCRIAFKGDRFPYIAPFQYVDINGILYFHFTNYGKKMDLFNQETPVCVEIEKYAPNLSYYQFVVLTGKLKLVKDPQEWQNAVEKMTQTGKKKLSPNFLVAHGFPTGSNWTDLSKDKSLLILKLDEETEKIGLKSP